MKELAGRAGHQTDLCAVKKGRELARILPGYRRLQGRTQALHMSLVYEHCESLQIGRVEEQASICEVALLVPP